MKVRILRTTGGLFNGQPTPTVGAVVEYEDHVGAFLCAKKIAEPVVELPVAPEKATAPKAPERRAKS